MRSPSPSDRRDVVIVGGGHNGLTAAAYLALAGKRVTIIEDVITTGGAVRDATRVLREAGAIVEVVCCAIDRSPAGENPLADVGLDVRAVLTKADLDAVRAGA